MERELARRIGAAARAARSALGASQGDAAEEIGISTEFYARIERGVTMPSVPTLVRMAGVLHISADVLLGLPTSAVHSPSPAKEPAEVTRLVRKLRVASVKSVRLLALLLSALEKTGTHQRLKRPRASR
jgi:transcriptional regulator with XRE-family HTH domain